MSEFQLSLPLEDVTLQQRIECLDPNLWKGCFNARESGMQQLAPYVGKMKSGMARVLISAYSEEGDTVLDPFCGSGTVLYEALALGRRAIGNDLNPYAYVISKGKLSAPPSEYEAIKLTRYYLDIAEAQKSSVDLEVVPEWVRQFFHPETLRETLALWRILRDEEEYFLQAGVLGILHHVRPGFLSYPASHLVPYLRTKKYPPEQFPHMYVYRDVRSRLLAKVKRAYRRYLPHDLTLTWEILQQNARKLSLPDECIDLILSSPPYFGALDYARDNRLRLWFLGVEDYRELESQLTSNDGVYVPQMTQVVSEMYRLLKPGNPAVLVLGDYQRNGRKTDSAETIARIAGHQFGEQFSVEEMIDDPIPDERRSRRRTRTTLRERILVLRKH
jgi:SAM-dependent methyltransferase